MNTAELRLENSGIYCPVLLGRILYKGKPDTENNAVSVLLFDACLYVMCLYD